MFKKCLCIAFSVAVLLGQFNLPCFAIVIIEDEVARESFRGQDLVRPVFKLELIEDYVARESFRGLNLVRPVFGVGLIEDYVARESFRGQKLVRPVYKVRIVSEDSRSEKIVVTPLSTIRTGRGNFNRVGDKIRFRVKDDVLVDGKLLLKKGAIVDAIVGGFVARSAVGTPAEITVERFVSRDVYGNEIEFFGDINKKGLDLTPLIAFAAYGANMFMFGLGYAVLMIPGGQAKITPKQEFAIYYEI